MTDRSFATVMYLFSAYARLEERFAGELGAVHGMALKEVLLLMHLERATLQRLSRIDLSKRLSTSPSTITRLTLPLEKRGVVAKEADARDARLAYVVLTDAGRRLVAEARATLERMSGDVFREQWTKDEIDIVSGLLGRLTAGQSANLLL